MTGLISIVNGDALHIPLRDGAVQTVITSIPYWGLRAYLADDDPLKPLELGLERTPEEYLEKMVAVFREVWRVMRPDGTLWLNIGDCYAGAPNGRSAADTKALGDDDRTFRDKPFSTVTVKSKRIERGAGRWGGGNNHAVNLKPKDLVMMPARLALALQADGWWIRSDIIWAKPNPMPESVTDRPTKSYEHVFLLTKNANYYYDAEAIKESGSAESAKRLERGISDHHKNIDGAPGQPPHTMNQPRENICKNGGGCYSKRYAEAQPAHGGESERRDTGYRNRRDVWVIATEAYSGSHFAVFPQKLVEPMILAGSSPQACETCGAPWERILEARNNREGGDRLEVGQSASEAMPQDYQMPITLGWRATCACPPERNTGAGRCLVLDPFAGTCTVGKVAVRHGRRFVGLELKPEYIELARARTDRTQMVMPG